MSWAHRVVDRIVHENAPRPPALAAIPAERVREVDVREDLRAGREPFSRIMEACTAVAPGSAVLLRAIFEPAPLYAVLGRQGFAHHTEQHAPDDWHIWFYRAADTADTRAEATSAADVEAAGEGVVVLDVRGLEPPDPMLRTLEALESLPEGGTLVQLNTRVPQFLLPVLSERGYHYEVREQSESLVRLFIRRGED